MIAFNNAIVQATNFCLSICFSSLNRLVLEKTLESPLQPVRSEDQPWDFFGRNDAKSETPVLWPSHAKS